jgi:H/ACA ribonucleoprotein complex subunit 3
MINYLCQNLKEKKTIRMARHIHKCSTCQFYTIEKKCSKCGGVTVLPRPPKFSLNDKYSGLRREVRKKELKKLGLI